MDQPAPAAPGQLAGYPTRCPHNLGRWRSAGRTEARTEGRKASSAVAGPLAGALVSALCYYLTKTKDFESVYNDL